MRIFASAPLAGVRIGLSQPIGGRGGSQIPFVYKLIGVLIAIGVLAFGHGAKTAEPIILTTDTTAMHAADRDCPNDGSHNLIRDANDESKWVCVAD